MRYLFICLLVGITSCKSGKIENTQLKSILKNFSHNSYYLSVTIQVKGNNEIAIIENSDCFLFLLRKMKINKEQYQQYIYQKITDNEVIFKGVDSLQRYGFTIVQAFENSLGNPVQIINDYFYKSGNYYIIKPSVDKYKKAVVISQLFYAGVYCSNDGESGMLMIITSELPAEIIKKLTV